MSKTKLKIATCQFPVSSDVARNARYVKRQIKRAAANGADVVHFSETALSGYPGSDFPSFKGYDWEALRAETREIMALAKACEVWVALGSSHYVSARVKPTNCLYIISPAGRIVDRYDKSMCTGGDLKAYNSGDHLVTLTLNGIRCGFLICYDSCFPEMYNAYRHRGVELMFHSFYNARHKGPNILDEIVPAWIRVRAADNRMWVIANNSCARHSCWPACIARPDGSMADSLTRHVPGILYHEFPDHKLKGWTHNDKMMKLHPNEVYHNGRPSKHRRAVDTRSLP